MPPAKVLPSLLTPPTNITSLIGCAVLGVMGAASAAQVYTIKAGDTLRGIAKKHDVSVERIISTNTIADPNKILVGQTISIPDSPANPGQPTGKPNVTPSPRSHTPAANGAQSVAPSAAARPQSELGWDVHQAQVSRLPTAWQQHWQHVVNQLPLGEFKGKCFAALQLSAQLPATNTPEHSTMLQFAHWNAGWGEAILRYWHEFAQAHSETKVPTGKFWSDVGDAIKMSATGLVDSVFGDRSNSRLTPSNNPENGAVQMQAAGAVGSHNSSYDPRVEHLKKVALLTPEWQQHWKELEQHFVGKVGKDRWHYVVNASKLHADTNNYPHQKMLEQVTWNTGYHHAIIQFWNNFALTKSVATPSSVTAHPPQQQLAPQPKQVAPPSTTPDPSPAQGSAGRSPDELPTFDVSSL